MMKLLKLSTRHFPITWEGIKSRKAVIAANDNVVPSQTLGANWIQCNSCLRYRRLPSYVQIQHLTQETWTCITTKQAINAPIFTKCDEWPQESGCPFLTVQLPSNSLLEEPLTAAVGRMDVRMRAHGIDSENDDSEHDSVDDMMRDQENDDSDSGNAIYHDRFRRQQQQQDNESEGDY